MQSPIDSKEPVAILCLELGVNDFGAPSSTRAVNLDSKRHGVE